MECHHSQEPLSVVDVFWELVDSHPFFVGPVYAVQWSIFLGPARGLRSEVEHTNDTVCWNMLWKQKWNIFHTPHSQLLKLRPRKDLVEKLLHEMTQSYLCVINNDKDPDYHGPQFCKHMRCINHLTGANIMIYHTFHEEMDEYGQHWGTVMGHVSTECLMVMSSVLLTGHPLLMTIGGLNTRKPVKALL